MDSDVPVPEQLQEPRVAREVLEDYVLARIRQFSSAFAVTLLGEANAAVMPVDLAFNQTMLMFSNTPQVQQEDSFCLRFTHRCKFYGCKNKDCTLCENNPHKRCSEIDNFDECYADNQTLRSKCDADVFVELASRSGVRPSGAMASAEVLISVIDGDSVGTGVTMRLDTVKELCKSDEGAVLLGAHVTGTKDDGGGRLVLKLQDGICRLPDIFIKDKNDTFHMDSHTYLSFRLMGRVVQRDLMGSPTVIVDTITPAVSEKFIVKTQRALHDYRKCEYPYYKDELTKLKYIGSITAQRLRDIQTHISNVPFTSVETVEQLKHLMLHAEQNRQVEAKLLEILNMKGKHKHKWEYLRQVLLERIVYDDMVHRAWFTDETMMQGLLFACKQGQANIDKPFGIAQRVVQGTQARLQVITPVEPQAQELMKSWRAMAEEAWSQPGHPGWTLVTEPLELVSLAPGQASAPQMSMSTDSAQGGSKLKRESTVSGPPSFAGYNFGGGNASHQLDGLTGAFQFSAQRAASARPSSAAPTPCSEGKLPGSLIAKLAEAAGATGSSGTLNPFAQVARGMAPAGSQDSPKAALGDIYHSAGGLGSPSGSGPGGFPLQTWDLTSRQGSTPHPFAAVARVRASRLMNVEHTPSTPAVLMQSAPQLIREALQGAAAAAAAAAAVAGSSAPEAETEALSGSGAEGAVCGPVAQQAPVQPQPGPLVQSCSSRLRRVSAADADHISQLYQEMLPTSLAAEAASDGNMLSKRPRTPQDGTILDPSFAGLLFDHIANSNTAFYHQESLGRHIPRSRTTLEPGQSLGPMQDIPSPHHLQHFHQHHQLPPAAAHQHLSADKVLLAAASPGLVEQQAVPAMVLRGSRPTSPAQHLSANMQDSLHIAEARTASDAATGAAASPGVDVVGVSLQPASESTPSRPPRLVAVESDSFNRTLTRLLQRSESDSFKRMLDTASFVSPAGEHAAQEFASFLETFAGQD